MSRSGYSSSTMCHPDLQNLFYNKSSRRFNELSLLTACGILFMNYPAYSYPPVLLACFARDVILLRRRNFQRDAEACIKNLKPPLQVKGNIPLQGPCVLTVNHYPRPRFAAQWITLAIAAVIPMQVHWIMTDEFTSWYRPLGAFASRLLLKRIAGVYGFTSMPPMPPRPQDVERRAVAVRAVLEVVRQRQDAVLGLAPEGYDPPAGTLPRPAAGVGRFALLLAKAGLTFIPVGAYEQDGAFHLHFGELYQINVAEHLPADEKDRAAAQIIMEAIARLLPLHLRGEFA